MFRKTHLKPTKEIELDTIAYKATDMNMKCRDFQYYPHKLHSFAEEPIEMCKAGLHSCSTIAGTFAFYNPISSRIFEVYTKPIQTELLTETVNHFFEKYVSNYIYFKKELSDKKICEEMINIYTPLEFMSKIRSAMIYLPSTDIKQLNIYKKSTCPKSEYGPAELIVCDFSKFNFKTFCKLRKMIKNNEQGDTIYYNWAFDYSDPKMFNTPDALYK